MKRQTKSLTIIVLILLVAIIGMTAWYMVNRAIPNQKYQQAVALRDGGQYEDAIAAFADLGDYSDAKTQIKETKYQQANHFTETMQYWKAYNLYVSISDYKDVGNLLKDNKYLLTASAIENSYTVGNYVTFGTYPQTAAGDDETPIEWLVLARNGSRAMLISRYGLDAQAFYNGNVFYLSDMTWENCTLRTWLNDTFFNKAFTPVEQDAILTTLVSNSQSQSYKTWISEICNSTNDKVFLLSYAEAHKYFNVEHWLIDGSEKNMAARVAPTAYAIAQGAWTHPFEKTTDDMPSGSWWLRSPGNPTKYTLLDQAARVYADGSTTSFAVYESDLMVRPALWVDIQLLPMQ